MTAKSRFPGGCSVFVFGGGDDNLQWADAGIKAKTLLPGRYAASLFLGVSLL